MAAVSLDASLMDLGLDSLMGVEVRQMLEREHDLTMSMRDIQHLTLRKLQELSSQAGSADGACGGPGLLALGGRARPVAVCLSGLLLGAAWGPPSPRQVRWDPCTPALLGMCPFPQRWQPPRPRATALPGSRRR